VAHSSAFAHVIYAKVCKLLSSYAIDNEQYKYVKEYHSKVSVFSRCIKKYDHINLHYLQTVSCICSVMNFQSCVNTYICY
jgi:hypothetical protein